MDQQTVGLPRISQAVEKQTPKSPGTALPLAFLTLVHGHLLRAMRLVDGKSANWLSPSRRLEEDVSADSYERFRACTAALGAEQLVGAYTSTWEWSLKLMDELATRHAITLPETLLNKLNRYIGVDQPPKQNF